MNGIIDQSFSLNIKILKIFCMFIFQESNVLVRIAGVSMYGFFTILMPILVASYLFFEKVSDMARFSDNAILLVQTACFIPKLLPFLYNLQAIKQCMYYFESPFFQNLEQKHPEIINECIKVCQRNSKVFFVFLVGANASFAVKPLITGELRLPADILVPQSWMRSTSLFWCCYLFVSLAESYNGFVGGCIDPLVGGLAYHATAQIKILKQNLKNLENLPDNQIQLCIAHHQKILKFLKCFENCFSQVVASQFAGGILVICFICFQLFKVQITTFNFWSMVIYLCVLLGQIYFYCYYGTILSEESSSINYAIFSSNWIFFDNKLKKNILLMMEKATKPVVVTAGKIAPLSLSTFTIILQRSYSLLALLKMYE